MTLFLFLKQITDMFYAVRWIDYLMAGFLTILILYQGWMILPREGEDRIKYKPVLPDICIILLSLMTVVHIIAGGNFDIYQNGKICTALMMYLLGRMAYKRAGENTPYLAVSSYIVIYVNVIIRFVILGYPGFFEMSATDNGMYYYGTDLAYAMLTGLIFVGMYGKNNILKFFTIFVVCPFMILSCVTGVQHILMWVIYVILLLFMSERAVKRRKFTDFLLPFMILLMLAVIVILNIPAITGDNDNILIDIFNHLKISTENFVRRYAGWTDIMSEISGSDSILLKIFGVGNATDKDISSLYIGIIYSLGYAGLVMFFLFIISIAGYAVKIYDRRTYYVTVMLAVLFLGTGINVFTIGFTQMSWFPLLYAGMVVGAANNADK